VAGVCVCVCTRDVIEVSVEASGSALLRGERAYEALVT
jgi:hypothetical protein